MMADDPGRAITPRSRRKASGGFVGVLVPLAVLTLAHAPLLVLHGAMQWARPHYQFFPLVLLGGMVLAIRAVRESIELRPGSRGWSCVLVGASWLLLASAVLLYSPLLGTVAALLTLLAAAQGVGGAPLVRRLLQAWTFLWLAIPPPLGLDSRLVTALQGVASRSSSALLDVLGVVHVMEGNVVVVTSRRLLVESSCSGIHSLFTALTCTLFAVFWVRPGLLRGAVLLAAAVGWVLVGNVIRIAAVAYLLTGWNLDLSEGWRHGALGLVTLALTLGLIASTDRLLAAIAGLFRLSASRLAAWNSLDLWDARPTVAVEPAPEPEPSQPPSAFASLRWSWLSSWAAASAFGALGLTQAALIWNALPDAAQSAPAFVRTLRQLNESALPESRGPFRRAGFESLRRDRDDNYGEFSLVWNYRWKGAPVAVSVDFPFLRGWHDLSICYHNRGWVTREYAVRPGAEGGDIAEETFVSPQGRHGYLLFAFFDAEGRPLSVPRRVEGLSALRSRLAAWRDPRRLWGGQSPMVRELFQPCYQVQLFVENELPPAQAEQAEARAFFEEVRRLVRRPASPGKGNGPGNGGSS